MFHKIARVVKNISFLLLSWQSMFLQKRLIKKVGYKRKSFAEGCSLDISQEAKDKRERIDSDLKGLLKQLKNNPKEIAEYLENHGVKIYLLKNGKKLLDYLHESEGFISSRKGFNAFFINLSVGNGFCFKSDELILFSGEEVDIYKLIRALYNWISYKEGLDGFDEKSQKKLWLLHNKDEDKIIARLSIPEMEGLQQAIKRDVEAIDFVTQYSKENAGAKNALNKIKNDGGANI